VVRNGKGGFYEVEFTNLGLKKVPINVDFIKRYPKLLVGGIWAITDVEYELPTDPKASPCARSRDGSALAPAGSRPRLSRIPCQRSWAIGMAASKPQSWPMWSCSRWFTSCSGHPLEILLDVPLIQDSQGNANPVKQQGQ
jgi:hypothetical protein